MVHFVNWPQKVRQDLFPERQIRNQFRSDGYESYMPISNSEPTYDNRYDHNLYEPKFQEFVGTSFQPYEQVAPLTEPLAPPTLDPQMEPALKDPEVADNNQTEIQNAINEVSGNFASPIFPPPNLMQQNFCRHQWEQTGNPFSTIPGGIGPTGGM